MDQRLHLFPWGRWHIPFPCPDLLSPALLQEGPHALQEDICTNQGCLSALLPELSTSMPGENPCAISQVLILNDHWGCGKPWLVLDAATFLHSTHCWNPLPSQDERGVAPLTKSLDNFLNFCQLCCKAEVKPNHCNISGFKRIAAKLKHEFLFD